MSDRKQALIDLLAKVEAGDIIFADVECCFMQKDTTQYPVAVDYVIHSFRGSLDAAKALHEAVLDGFFWDAKHIIRDGVRAHQYFVRRAANCHWSEDRCPARAWLIAIIKALIEQEDDQ